MSDPVVDIHCHTFNGDDLPVRGFISHVGLHNSNLGSVLARLVDLAVQGRAPGYEAEKARLDALLGGPDLRGIYGPESAARAIEPDPREQLTADTERALQELQVRSAPLLEDVRTAMQAAYSSEAGALGVEARAFDFGLVRRPSNGSCCTAGTGWS